MFGRKNKFQQELLERLDRIEHQQTELASAICPYCAPTVVLIQHPERVEETMARFNLRSANSVNE